MQTATARSIIGTEPGPATQLSPATIRRWYRKPSARTWKLLPYELDPWAQDFVRDHPDGANLDAMADAMGVSVALVGRILSRALGKIRDDAD